MARQGLASITALLLVLAVAASGCAGTMPDGSDAPAAAGTASDAGGEEAVEAAHVVSAPERELFRMVNLVRRAEGLPALGKDDRLNRVARGFAEQMAEGRFFAHVDPEGGDLVGRLDAVDYPYGMAGENIAAGREDAAGTMADWLDSPGHRKNILATDADQIGVGYAHYDGEPGEPVMRDYWVMVVGREHPPGRMAGRPVIGPLVP